MKKWQVLLMGALAFVLLASVPVVAFAANEEAAVKAQARPLIKGALAIVAPWVGFVGKELTMTVFLRENQEPFPGAGVWAFTKEEAEAIKEELKQLKQTSGQPTVESYESALEGRGIFLGRTGGNGKLAYTFAQAGGYILVAARNGYIPGFTHISIRDTIKALGIQAPKRVQVDENVTMTVFERITQDPVEDAGVWAVTRDKIEELKEQAQALKEDTSVPAADKDYEALVKGYGFFLGTTDKHGKLDHTFNEANIYVLIAVKRGYIPGFTPLAVVTVPKALGIKVTPPQTHVGKEVTINVFDRQSNDVIEGAGVWAIGKDQIAALKEKVAELRGDKSTAAEAKDYESVLATFGGFLGKTDDKGRLDATFNQPGGYLLVAAKRGYIPGYTTLAVRDMPQPKPSTSAQKPSTAAQRPLNVQSSKIV